MTATARTTQERRIWGTDEFVRTHEQSAGSVGAVQDFQDYLKTVTPKIGDTSVTALVDEFKAAINIMRSRIGQNEKFDDEVLWNLKAALELTKKLTTPNHIGSWPRYDAYFLECMQRIVAIVRTLKVSPWLVPVVLRTLRHAAIPSAYGFRVASVLVEQREGANRFSDAELEDWANHTLATMPTWDRNDITTVVEIQTELDRRRIS